MTTKLPSSEIHKKAVEKRTKIIKKEKKAKTNFESKLRRLKAALNERNLNRTFWKKISEIIKDKDIKSEESSFADFEKLLINKAYKLAKRADFFSYFVNIIISCFIYFIFFQIFKNNEIFKNIFYQYETKPLDILFFLFVINGVIFNLSQIRISSYEIFSLDYSLLIPITLIYGPIYSILAYSFIYILRVVRDSIRGYKARGRKYNFENFLASLSYFFSSVGSKGAEILLIAIGASVFHLSIIEFNATSIIFLLALFILGPIAHDIIALIGICARGTYIGHIINLTLDRKSVV